MKIQNQLKMAHSASVALSFLINAGLVILLLFFLQTGEPVQPKVGTIKIIEPDTKLVIDPLPVEPKVTEISEADPDDWTDFNPEPVPTLSTFETEPEIVKSVADVNPNLLENLMFTVTDVVILTGLPIRSEPERKKRLEDYAPETGDISEPAVLKALDWLREHQKADGSWDKEGRVSAGAGNSGYTGLALLCFLAHGEKPSGSGYGVTVGRALRYLVENQDSRGVFQPAGSHTVYGHAIATYAMAEAFAMTQNHLLKEPLERAVRVIMEGMQPHGGYDYEYKGGTRNDSSVGAWQLQALKAAWEAGVDRPLVAEKLQTAMEGLLANAKREGDRLSFGYTGPGERGILSAAGTLCLHLAGRDETRDTQMAHVFLRAFTTASTLPDWNAGRSTGEHGGEINFWYYAAQAFFHQDPKGRDFRAFYPAMVRALARGQEPDGSWRGVDDKALAQGVLYNTTLASLSLMTPYRHLTTTQAARQRRDAPPSPGIPQVDDPASFSIE
jgi:hypothetical protein